VANPGSNDGGQHGPRRNPFLGNLTFQKNSRSNQKWETLWLFQKNAVFMVEPSKRSAGLELRHFDQNRIFWQSQCPAFLAKREKQAIFSDTFGSASRARGRCFRVIAYHGLRPYIS